MDIHLNDVAKSFSLSFSETHTSQKILPDLAAILDTLQPLVDMRNAAARKKFYLHTTLFRIIFSYTKRKIAKLPKAF